MSNHASLPTTAPRARIGIIGLGLMGGSLARALKALPDPPHVSGASTESDDRRRALDTGAVDEAHHDASQVAAAADLLIYATPLAATLSLFDAHRELWGSETVVTDVGSLKKPLLDRVHEERFTALGVHERYVGSHPMTGGTGSGFRASTPGLYRASDVYLVQGSASEAVAEQVQEFWQSLEANPLWIQAAEHDHRMAWCSHLPQLVSNALAGALEVEGFEVDALGPGGRDMVRLTGSSPLMWRDILDASGPEVVPALRSVARALNTIAELLEAGDAHGVAAFMDRTRLWMRQGALSPLAPPPDSVGVVDPRPPAPSRES